MSNDSDEVQTCNAFIVVAMLFFEFCVQIFTDLDVLEHTCQLVDKISWHAHFL